MNSTQKPGRRIVSKTEYAAAEGRRMAVGLSGCGLLIAGLPVGLSLISYGAIKVVEVLQSLTIPDASQMATLVILGVFCVPFGIICLWLVDKGIDQVLRAEQMDSGIPHTRATTPDLPAPDILVRASQEPTQAQKAILLRAAGTGQEQHCEQLLRAAGGQE